MENGFRVWRNHDCVAKSLWCRCSCRCPADCYTAVYVTILCNYAYAHFFIMWHHKTARQNVNEFADLFSCIMHFKSLFNHACFVMRTARADRYLMAILNYWNCMLRDLCLVHTSKKRKKVISISVHAHTIWLFLGFCTRNRRVDCMTMLFCQHVLQRPYISAVNNR